MRAEKVSVQARRADGTLETRTRTLYTSEFGPIFTSVAGEPLFPWTLTTAYAMDDANASNFRFLNHFMLVDRAQSTKQLDRIERSYQGIPWVNTIAADSKGRAYYADIGTVPHATNAEVQRCNTPLGDATFADLGLPVLDGSRSSCHWGIDPDAAVPGILGPSRQPSLFRNDYVTNSNDSYWLANPAHPLEGFDRIIGDERTARSLRTRLGLRIVADQLARGRFTLRKLSRAVFNDRQHAGELMRDDLVTYCRTQPDLAAACDVLAHWDLHDNLDSHGAVLFRRFASRLLDGFGNAGPPGIWNVPFDPSDPVNTPRGLNTASPLVGAALGVTLRQVQWEQRGRARIPIHGGPGDPEGDFNAINAPFVAGQGYPDVPHGSSFVTVVQLTKGCPRSRSILTYSLSANPRSRWYADQTRMFSRKQWVHDRFCERQILASPALKVTRFGPR
jgi:acyl-homoserine-lactone acylase